MFRVGGGQRSHAWKLGGLLYFNPRDPAMWVEVSTLATH
jgi:uncharacterized membrane protein